MSARQPVCDIRTITPDIAKALLGRNRSNRAVRPSRVRYYSELLKSGDWKLNGETIKVSMNGNLMDGQHRLIACSQTNIPFKTYYVEVEDESSFDTIDLGATRTLNDILVIRGEKNTIALSAMLPLLDYYYKHGELNQFSRRMHNSDIDRVLATFPDARKHAAFADSRGKDSAGLFTKTTVGTARYILTRVDQVAADKFIEDMLIGQELKAGDPVLALRNTALKLHIASKTNAGKTPRPENFYYIALVFKAWNMRRRGRTAKTISFDTNKENYPKPL